MALFTTDWTNELAQVNESLKTLINEEVKPLIEQSLNTGISAADNALNKASLEIQAAIGQLSDEADKQRKLLVRDVWKMIIGSILMVTLAGTLLIILFKTL